MKTQKAIKKMMGQYKKFPKALQYEMVADKLGITSRWVRYLEIGEKKPSGHLEKLIQILAQ